MHLKIKKLKLFLTILIKVKYFQFFFCKFSSKCHYLAINVDCHKKQISYFPCNNSIKKQKSIAFSPSLASPSPKNGRKIVNRLHVLNNIHSLMKNRIAVGRAHEAVANMSKSSTNLQYI